MSHPKNVAPKVAKPMLIKGSVGTILVMLSAMSGTSEKVITAAAVEAADVMIDDASAYRRREVRRRKNVFQSRAFGEGVELELEGEAVVEALRVRHNDGAKEDDGVMAEEEECATTAWRADDGRRYRVCGMRAAVDRLHRDFGRTLFEAFNSGRV